LARRDMADIEARWAELVDAHQEMAANLDVD
jgi:hypothetical protein